MSEERDDGEITPDEESALRRAFGDGPGSSRAHDERVLAAAREAAHDIVRRRRKRPAGWRPLWLAPAAALALALLAVPLIIEDDGEPALDPSVVRGPAQAVTPADESELAAPPQRFAWPAVAGATAYRVIVHDAAARPVWGSGAVEATELELAPGALTLEPGATYLWTVEAAAGESRIELGPWRFRLQPRASLPAD